jgi:hypothetical protein
MKITVNNFEGNLKEYLEKNSFRIPKVKGNIVSITSVDEVDPGEIDLEFDYDVEESIYLDFYEDSKQEYQEKCNEGFFEVVPSYDEWVQGQYDNYFTEITQNSFWDSYAKTHRNNQASPFDHAVEKLIQKHLPVTFQNWK